jgi:hypothetical protein
LAGILVLQILVVAVVFWPRAGTEVGDAPLFAGVEAGQIVELTIREAEDEIHLEKQGEMWVLADAGNYPCQEAAVPGVLDKLVALKADRLVTETRSSHDRLKVADANYERVVEFKLQGGARHVLYVGTSPSYGVSHVRLEGKDEVYLVSGLSSTDVSARATNWIDTAYVTLDQSQVVAMTLQNANGTFEFAKDASGAWVMAGLGPDEPLKSSAVSSMLSRVSSLRMTAPLGRTDQGYGTDSPGAVLTVQTRDAEGAVQVNALIVGNRSEDDNSYAVKWSGSDYYAYVAKFSVNEWVEHTRESFIEPPATPTPGTGG